MSAPNFPVGTSRPSSSATRAVKRSYIGREKASGAALTYDGRLPLRVEACSVNWLTTSTSPPTCRTSRFITPCSSSKIRRRTSLPARYSISSSVSSTPTPTSTSRPCPIRDSSTPPTLTEAFFTR